MRHTFQPEPETDFSEPANITAFQAALAAVRSRLGSTYPMIIDGRDVTGSSTFSSTCPAHPDLVVGGFPQADQTTAVAAIEAADRAFGSWSRVPGDERARYLFAAAARLRQRRMELAAWMVYEVGKSWAEADGEVAECIDLMEYYGRQMLLLDGPQNERLGRLANEDTEFFYIPLGAGVVISPWNFPMALTFGMAGAAIVAGNTVVIKPASNSPVSVIQVARIFSDLGLPPGVLNVVTGKGGVIGDALVDHPRARFVAFTGSMDVGIRLHERAAKIQPGQLWIKRTILELGGKNAVIVDDEADIDAAADGVAVSAFGFQGQKCSAGSRAIVHERVYDAFVERLTERVSRLRVGDPVERDVTVGPVIDRQAFSSIREHIARGAEQGTELFRGTAPSDGGFYIPPTIFGDVAPDAVLAQEEIFGPVLACLKARDFDDALQIANRTRYGLTGAVFTKNREKLRKARSDFHVGNLYFNRRSTGAMMGVHPFGGFNMSGTDSKAGGPDYLLHFLQGKSVGERLW